MEAWSNISYVPILKGRAGELRALQEISSSTAAQLVPLIEIPLISDDVDSEDPNTIGITANVAKFSTDLAKRWRADQRVIVDASQVPINNGPIPTVDLIHQLAQKYLMFTPTVRPSDPPWAIAAIGQALRQWQISAACIRLAGDDLDDNEIPLSTAIENLLAGLSLPPAQIDLVLDFGSVIDEQAMSFAARIARLVIGELPYINEWNTLVCASGAFPPDLNSIQPEVLTEVPRHDAGMWNAVRTRVRSRVPIFGDYAIAYPSQTTGALFAPAPQLRFTSETNWLVMKGRKQNRRGARQFYDICSRISDSGHVNPSLSWGDRYIELAAQSVNLADAQVGTGNAMIWRAVGTSHHIAYVASRLATTGAP